MGRAEAFLSEFVLPLVAGGEVHVSAPLDAQDVVELRAEATLGGDPTLTSEALQAVERARQARVAELWIYPVSTPWDDAAIALAVGAHNLLFFSHPDAKRWSVSRRRSQQVLELTARLLQRGPCVTVEEVLARHTLLVNLPHLSRTDVVVDYWAAIEEFHGQRPPRRLLRWPRLRRVRQNVRTLSWLHEDNLTDDQLQLLGSLLALSPLTDLVTPHRTTPPFSWEPHARYLQHPQLARLLCHLYLETGLPRVGPALARAFWELTGTRLGPRRRATAAIVCQFLLYLIALHQLPHLEPEPLAGASIEDPVSSLASVLVAAADCHLLPEGEALGDGELLQRLQRQVLDARKPLGAETTDNLAARLRAAME